MGATSKITMTINLDTKRITTSGSVMAYPENVTVKLVGYSPADPSNLGIYLYHQGTRVAECVTFVDMTTYAEGEMSLDTVALGIIMNGVIHNSSKLMDVVIWDTTEENVLVNDRVAVYGTAFREDDPSPVASTLATISGSITKVTGGEVFPKFTVLKMSTATGRAVHCGSDVKDNQGLAIGIALNACTADGQTVFVISYGSVEDSSFAWTLNIPLFYDGDGKLTQTAPTSGFTHAIGIPVTATRILVFNKNSVGYADATGTGALKKPLVVYNGIVQEIRDGDNVNVTVGSHSALTNLDYSGSGHTGFQVAKGVDEFYVSQAEKDLISSGGTGNVKLSQATPQTIGSTSERLAKLWATDITVTNAIAGSITGNAGTATTAGKLTSAVTINGVSFDGSANVAIPSNIAPGTNGNVLTSNGTVWTSAPSTAGTSFISLSDTVNSYSGASGKTFRVNATETGLEFYEAVGSGTVTTVSVVTANGISGSVATATTTPAITLTLGAITPSTCNGLTLASQTTGFTIAGGTTSKTLTVADNASVSGTNTGDSATPAETTSTIGTLINGANAKATPIDADLVGFANTESSNVLVKATWSNVKAFLKTYFDTLYTGGTGITWSAVTADTPMVADNGYLANKSSLCVCTLPSTCAVGKTVRVAGMNVNGWKIAQGALQYIKFGSASTTVGATGYISSTATYDAIELVCIDADKGFIVTSSVGNLTIV